MTQWQREPDPSEIKPRKYNRAQWRGRRGRVIQSIDPKRHSPMDCSRMVPTNSRMIREAAVVRYSANRRAFACEPFPKTAIVTRALHNSCILQSRRARFAVRSTCGLLRDDTTNFTVKNGYFRCQKVVLPR